MAIGMILKVVTRPDDLPCQIRPSPDANSYDKKSGFGTMPLKDIEDPRSLIGIGTIING